MDIGRTRRNVLTGGKEARLSGISRRIYVLMRGKESVLIVCKTGYYNDKERSDRQGLGSSISARSSARVLVAGLA